MVDLFGYVIKGRRTAPVPLIPSWAISEDFCMPISYLFRLQLPIQFLFGNTPFLWVISGTFVRHFLKGCGGAGNRTPLRLGNYQTSVPSVSNMANIIDSTAITCFVFKERFDNHRLHTADGQASVFYIKSYNFFCG